jgi:hypothetical protein
MQCDEALLDEVESALIGWFDPPLNGAQMPKISDASNRIKWRLAAVMADREIDYKELLKHEIEAQTGRILLLRNSISSVQLTTKLP